MPVATQDLHVDCCSCGSVVLSHVSLFFCHYPFPCAIIVHGVHVYHSTLARPGSNCQCASGVCYPLPVVSLSMHCGCLCLLHIPRGACPRRRRMFNVAMLLWRWFVCMHACLVGSGHCTTLLGWGPYPFVHYVDPTRVGAPPLCILCRRCVLCVRVFVLVLLGPGYHQGKL